MKIIFTELAQQDIQKSVGYISTELHNPIAASNFLEKIFKSAKILERFPEVSSLIKFNNMPTRSRFLVVNNYLLLYVVKGNCVYVTRIVYGQSNYLRYLGA